MLVLSRQRDESLVFDFSGMSDEELLELRHDPIEVTVCTIEKDKARIGTSAPRTVVVLRREIYNAINSPREDVPQVVRPPVILGGVPAPRRDPYVSRRSA